jgi:hypothetical protein
LVFAIRKISVVKKQEKKVEIRNMKKFDHQKFVEDLYIYISLLKILTLCGKFGRNYS